MTQCNDFRFTTRCYDEPSPDEIHEALSPQNRSGPTREQGEPSRLQSLLAGAQRLRLEGETEDQIIAYLHRASRPEAAKDAIEFFSGPQLAALDTTLTFLVDDLIVRGQPLLMAGPKKCLKTNIAIDLVLSLSSGLPLLGQYEITTPIKAGLMSSESGAATIKETAHRVAIAKGLDGVQDVADAVFAFQTPLVRTADQCEQFRQIIETQRLEFLIIDPTYLTFAVGDRGGNLFQMGELLAPLSVIGQETGCTICLSHHAKKPAGKDGMPLDLGDEAYSGFSEWARQWLFLSRREAYDEARTGSHRLWLRWGGSAGHSGLIGLDIEEGSRKDTWGRRWDVRIEDATEISQARRDEADAKRDSKAAETFAKHVQQARDALTAFPYGATLTDLASKARLSKTNCQAALYELQAANEVETCDVRKNKRDFEGWKICERDNGTK